MAAHQHSFNAYQDILNWLRKDKISTWAEVQTTFLDATSAFDTVYSKGNKSKGWYQAKARYFNDIIVELLSNASKRPMATRKKKKSQLFTKLDIDVCYPDHDPPIIGAEVKALGAPPHPGNSMKGRPARSDLHKRIREVAFTSIDFKVANAGPAQILSFQNWIDSSPPGYFSFWAMRVEDDADFDAVRTMLVNLRTYCNGVGAVLFACRSAEQSISYKPREVDELDIDRVIREIAQRVA